MTDFSKQTSLLRFPPTDSDGPHSFREALVDRAGFQIDDKCFERRPSEGGIQILSTGQTILVSSDVVIIDADETQLADTLEHFHDGVHGRFAQAVRMALAARGINVEPEQLDTEGAWTKVRKALSGQTEDKWYEGLCRHIEDRFYQRVEPQALAELMKDVLSGDKVNLFTDKVKPVKSFKDLSAAFDGQEVPRHLCTTTDEWVIRPLLDYYDLLDGVKFLKFGATKKVKDDNAPGGQAFKGECVVECLAHARIPPKCAIMIGDSIADWGTAAAAGLRAVVLRPANFLVEKLGSYAAAAAELQRQVTEASSDYPELAGTKVVIVPGFENVMVLPRRERPENRGKRPAIVWTGEFTDSRQTS